MHHKHKQARIVMVVSLQEAAQTQARMHHKHNHARNMIPLCGGSLEGCRCSRREVLDWMDQASRGAEPAALLCETFFSKKNE